jgi:cytidylate kinase
MMKNYVITIGRQLGAGGAVLGKAIAEHYGFQYIDKEFVVLAGKNLHAALEDIQEYNEKNNPNWINMTRTAMNTIPYLGDSWVLPTSKKLYEEQTNIMKKAAEEGPCVVIGRCGSQIFKDHENHISVFLHGDIESRAARLAAVLGKEVDPEKDGKRIEREDKERAKYYQNFTGKKWDDIKEYDFVLNTSSLSDEQVMEVVFGYIEAKFPELKK